MDDPAYKQLFSRPRMIEDLLHGFAARDWSGALDFASLAPLPASYVSHDLRQRHGDLGVARALPRRAVAVPGAAPGVPVHRGPRDGGADARRRWNAAADVSELIASGGAALARYQPSQRYFLLDEGRVGDADLPGGNLVSALIALETSRDRERLPELLGSLIGLLREQGDEELTQAFRSWVVQVLLPRRFRGGESGWLPRLEEVRTMLAEQVREWTEEWVEEGREQGREQGIAQGREQGIAQGREQGIAQGRAEERALLCRQAERKFDAATARRLAAALEDVADAGRLAQVGDWIIECGTAADLLARVSDERRRGV